MFLIFKLLLLLWYTCNSVQPLCIHKKGSFLNNSNSFINNELNNYYGDKRLLELLKYNKKGDFKCIYCYEKANTREHIPSKIFLNEPYSNNLAILPACFNCNNSYSENEQYLACLIDYVQYKLYNLKTVKRDKIKKAFTSRPHIKNQLEESTIYLDNGKLHYIEYNHNKIKDILLKLAIGHATYSLSKIYFEEPNMINYKFFTELSNEEVNNFNEEILCDISPEIGSRSFDNIAFINGNIPLVTWNIVQYNQYRYLVYESKTSTNVKIVIGEFFYSEVIWTN